MGRRVLRLMTETAMYATCPGMTKALYWVPYTPLKKIMGVCPSGL
jgi:hypothetical protein